MKCSRIVSTLSTAVIAVGMIGLASAGSRTGVAAEFSANPTLGQTVNLFESVNDWRAFKFMEELVTYRAKYAFLIPTPYKIAIARAAHYALKLSATIESDSIDLKSMFSSKMRGLLSTRWDDKPSPVSKELGDAAQETDEDGGNFSAGMEDDANANEKFSVYDWLYGDWTFPYFSYSNYFDFDNFFGIGNAKPDALPAGKNVKETPDALPSESSPAADANTGNGDNTLHLNDSTRYFFNDFDGSSSDYAEAEYSMKYGNAVGVGIDNPPAEKAAENAEETAAPPQSSQSGASGGYFDSADNFLKHYLGNDAISNPILSVDSWGDTVFSAYGYSSAPIIIGPETPFFYNSPTLPVLYGSGFYPLTGQNESSAETENNKERNSTPAEESISDKPNSGTLLNHLVDCFKAETNNWAGAFHHIAVQFSLIHEVF